MEYKCFDCGEEFDESVRIVKHLKELHKYKDHSVNLKCFVNKTNQCKNTFLTFNGLQKHVRICLKKKIESGRMTKTDIGSLSQSTPILEVYLYT